MSAREVLERACRAMEALAQTKPQQDTVGMIHAAIIEHTGDGQFADHVWELLTDGPVEARAALTDLRALLEGAVEIWAEHDPVKRHDEPLYYWTDEEVRDGLEHIRGLPGCVPALLLTYTKPADTP